MKKTSYFGCRYLAEKRWKVAPRRERGRSNNESLVCKAIATSSKTTQARKTAQALRKSGSTFLSRNENQVPGNEQAKISFLKISSYRAVQTRQ